MSYIVQHIQSEYGMPISDLLIELYGKHGNVHAIAVELGVSQATISNWITRHNLEFRKVLVHIEETSYASSSAT